MTYNPYDNADFFKKYSQMDRSVKGLSGAGEWKTLEAMLPDFAGKRVLDLGCGFGWHCQYAAEHGAKTVVGVDISEKMLAVAKSSTDERIQYLCCPIQETQFEKDSFDVVISSLAFHYLPSFDEIAEKVSSWLVSGGAFVFSVEHPVFTAQGTQDWVYSPDGKILHFPVDRYFYEGQREACFLGETIMKHHRTLTTYLNGLLQEGFELTGFAEPQPSAQLLEAVPGMKEELRRPMMLILAARKCSK